VQDGTFVDQPEQAGPRRRVEHDDDVEVVAAAGDNETVGAVVDGDTQLNERQTFRRVPPRVIGSKICRPVPPSAPGPPGAPGPPFLPSSA